MAECSGGRWLLLIHQLPPNPAYLRVKVWRRLQGLGAVAIKNTVYVIPKTDGTLEDFQWVVREIVKDGGEATICAASFIEGLSDEQAEALFRAARDADYSQFAEDARELLSSVPRRAKKEKNEDRSAFVADLNRLRKRLASIAAIDFFTAPGRSAAEAVMLQLESRLRQARRPGSGQPKDGRLNASEIIRVFIPKARLLTQNEIQALPVKDKDSAAAEGLWVEVACPDDSCTVDGGRICLPAASAATKNDKGVWLKIFCPEDRCYFDSASELP